MNNNKLALIVAYYLARFDREGLEHLGFPSFNHAFEETSRLLNVKKNYVKLRRDEFDPAFPWRTGWQRPMDPQILKTIETFQDLGESDMREIVSQILKNPEYRHSPEVSDITALLHESKHGARKPGKFILRSPTGKQAEEYFIKHYNKNKRPVEGVMKDTRDMGCGYDFEIITASNTYRIEVKGLSEITGGLLFTNKEWNTAKEYKDLYYLVIVKNLKTDPSIHFIQNPTVVLSAKRSVYTSVQIQWVVTEKELWDHETTTFSSRIKGQD